MYFDNNGFLSLESDITNPKLYTHTIVGQDMSHEDHLVIVWHKDQLKKIHWKDLGKTMMLLRGNREKKEDIDHRVINILTLFSGFDENTGQSYYFFPKVYGKQLIDIAQSLGTLQIIDENKGWFSITNTSQEEDNILYKIFVLYVVGGNALVKGDNLSSIKIQIQIPIPFFYRKEMLDGLLQNLQNNGYAIAGYFTEQKNNGLYEITSNDYDVLSYLQEYDKSLASVKKITTKEIADKVQSQLFEEYPESKALIGGNTIKLFEVK